MFFQFPFFKFFLVLFDSRKKKDSPVDFLSPGALTENCWPRGGFIGATGATALSLLASRVLIGRRVGASSSIGCEEKESISTRRADDDALGECTASPAQSAQRTLLASTLLPFGCAERGRDLETDDLEVRAVDGRCRG